MPETSNTLLNETSDLLEELIPVLNRNIQILQNDINPQGGALQFLLQQEIEDQENLLHRTRELQETVNRYMNPEPIDILPVPPIGDVTVIMSGGQQICRIQVSKTFVEAIETIGIEEVKSLNMEHCRIPIIATFFHPTYTQVPSGEYFIMTNSDTRKKIEQLNEIKRRLNLDIEVVDNR